jgi:ribosomal protein S18 acetylase RimI-like enzyme
MGTDPEIRRIETPDVASASALLARFFAEEGFALPAEGLEPRVRTYTSLDHHGVFAAADEGEDVGVVTVAAGYSLEYGWVAEIEDLYVVPSHRGRGIGRALVERACEHAREDGCSAVLVTVRPDGQVRHGLVGFYGRIGFADEGRQLMERRL